MRGELNHVLHPRHTYIKWGIFYLLLLVGLIAAFFLVTGRIRTYSVPIGAIQLDVPYKTYLLGEPITFTLTNNFNSTVYIANECPSEPLAVYKQDSAGSWVRVHAKTAITNCLQDDRQIRVAPGGQQSGGYANWPELFNAVGKYRIVAYVQYFDVAPYQDFEVIARPAPAPTPATTTTPTSTPRTTNTDSNEEQQTSTAPALTTKTVTLSAGSITVQYSSTMIYVQSITPTSGCTYEGGQSGSTVNVNFVCSQTETQVTLSLSGGQLVVRTKNDD